VRLRALLRSRLARLVAGAVAYVVVACAALAGAVRSGLTPGQRQTLGEVLAAQGGPLVLGAVVALTGLVLLLVRGLGGYSATARRLAADVRLLLGANAGHRLDPAGPPELGELAAAVNELAQRRQTAETEVAREVQAARADLEQERNRLAALMSDLTVAVLLCSSGGRILLYNPAARTLLADDPMLGLGRSVFEVVDRGLITHALERVQDGSVHAHASTALRDGRLLQVRLAPVRAGGKEVTGFVLVLEDMTGQSQDRHRRDELLRGLTEGTRASLASIRAAVETVQDYPDMEPVERRQFVEIIREEAQRLGEQVEGRVAEAAGLAGDWSLTEMAGEDLLAVLGREIERETGVVSRAAPDPARLWLRVDSHALARALGHLAARLRDTCGPEQLTLSVAPVGRHCRLDARWAGRAPDVDVFTAWLDEPLVGVVAASVREVVDRHDAEIWSGADPDAGAYLRLLLPVTDAAPQQQAPDHLDPHGPPEFYDFDLFDLPEESLAWRDRPLSELAYTVFDTETTGFHPTEGDEIISLGAVRVVNGRLLRHETFERLVDPGRRVPASAAAVHGITTEMVAGQPPLEVTLPVFARFAEGTVLVGHNVGFDMSFFRARQERTGVRFAQPVLDTLLLDAAIHPDHERHSLEAVAERLGVDVTGRHTALGDALVTGEVFVGLLSLLRQRGIHTLGDAHAASRATYQARLDTRLYGS